MIANHVAQVDEAEAKAFYRDSGDIVAACNDAKAWGADAAMELHFNAAGPSATGSETLYVISVSRPLAEAAQDATVSVLGIRDPGSEDAARGERRPRCAQFEPDGRQAIDIDRTVFRI